MRGMFSIAFLLAALVSVYVLMTTTGHEKTQAMIQFYGFILLSLYHSRGGRDA